MTNQELVLPDQAVYPPTDLQGLEIPEFADNKKLLGKVSLAEARIRAPLLSKLWRERQVTWALESAIARIQFRFCSWPQYDLWQVNLSDS